MESKKTDQHWRVCWLRESAAKYRDNDPSILEQKQSRQKDKWAQKPKNYEQKFKEKQETNKWTKNKIFWAWSWQGLLIS